MRQFPWCYPQGMTANWNARTDDRGAGIDNYLTKGGETAEWKTLRAAIDKVTDYMTEPNIGNGAWMMWRVLGAAGE